MATQEVALSLMNLAGISDSLAGLTWTPHECPLCHGAIRIEDGQCLYCLLGVAQEPEEEADPAEKDFAALLSEIDLPDSDWRLGNYQILEEIGRGGMGVIYRARQRHSRRIVALKRVLSYHGDSRETLERFRREAQAAASLDHPNILPIYEVGEADGLPFFTMKYATGGSVQGAAPALHKDPRECVHLLAKVTRAVAYAHGEGILHRDLKPGNILLDSRGEPMVTDFGLAKWIDTTSDLTRSLAVFGTPGYIAPEQASGNRDELTSAADVYSLGAILFYLLAGRAPFLGEHALAVISRARETEAPKLRSLIPNLDRDLETICSKCLEREAKLRYRSAADLAEDLERWLEGRPIVARPVAPPVKLWRWGLRNKKLAGSLLICAVLGAAGIGWLTENRHLERSLAGQYLADRSIAILPFLDLDTAKPDEAVTRRLAEVLEKGLSQSAPARATPLLAVKPWLAGSGDAKDVTAAVASLRVRAVLTGTHRAVPGGRRLSIRILNPSSGETALHRVFELSDGASSLAEAIRSLLPEVEMLLRLQSLTDASPTKRDPGLSNQAAREFLISGRQLMFRVTVADIDRAIGCFERALRMEPESPAAHAFLSSALGGRNHYVPDAAGLNRAEEEARIALRLDPNSADAHRALGGVLYQRGQLAAAQEEQLRGVEAAGTEERIATSIGLTSVALGEPVRALGWLEMAQHWATLPGDYDGLMGNAWALLLDEGRAEAAYRRAIDLRPEIPDGWIGLAHLKLQAGDFEVARRIAQECRKRFHSSIDPDGDIGQLEALIEFYQRDYPLAEQRYRTLATSGAESVKFESIRARLLQFRGENEAAREILERLRDRATTQLADFSANDYFQLAAVESCLGNASGALDNLRSAVAAGWLDLRVLELDPRFDLIASEEPFREIKETLRHKIAELRGQLQKPYTERNDHEQYTQSRLE